MPNNKKASPFGDAHKSPSIRFDFDPDIGGYLSFIISNSPQKTGLN